MKPFYESSPFLTTIGAAWATEFVKLAPWSGEEPGQDRGRPNGSGIQAQDDAATLWGAFWWTRCEPWDAHDRLLKNIYSMCFLGLLRNRAWHNKLKFCMFCSYLYLIWSMNPLDALVCLHHVQLGINRTYRSQLIPPGSIPPMPKMLRNRNRVLPRDEIRQAASQAKQLSEIQFQGFSLVAWSGAFHIKFYCSARTKLVCILMEAL